VKHRFLGKVINFAYILFFCIMHNSIITLREGRIIRLVGSKRCNKMILTPLRKKVKWQFICKKNAFVHSQNSDG
jgi:hypothetical protein